MNHYKLLNNLFGWGVFVISALVYTLTLEPTASFWDCGEFISSAYKLEISHPPGNPIFMLTARFFANFASDPSQVAYMVNFMSGLLSAGTILFLFWTITHLSRRLLVVKNQDMTSGNIITILGCGLVGSLLYAFTDTFWFSAVEGEVYAYSSFCTALVFWLILKWEQVADEPHAERYIILIAYLIGISIGVHLLNLLCIPAIVLVYYYKKNPDADLKGSIKALFISFFLIAALLYGLIPGFVKIAGWAELFFVNIVGLPFNSGVAIYFFSVIAAIIWGIYETYSQKSSIKIKISFLLVLSMMGVPFIGNSIWIGIAIISGLSIYLFTSKHLAIKLINTTLLSLMVIFIGYSSYGLILIRSSANPPMNQNAPNDIFTLASYLNREQYGDRPLFYGNTFVSEVLRNPNGSVVDKKGNAIWREAIKTTPNEKDKYVISGYKSHYVYNPDLDMFFPRMHSTLPEHVNAYKNWINFKGKPVTVKTGEGSKIVQKPTFAENLRFFIHYQVNYMYWRYFMWNFSGRQNDIQGHGGILDGNWLTGFNFIDRYFLGDQSTLPDSMQNNPGRNTYYMMPLLLGLIGLFYQAYRGKTGIQQFWVIFFLFFMTGLAIVVYLNQTPLEPRERDYAYAGSFYAFSIWIGLGVAAIQRMLQKRLPEKTSALIATLICIFIPFQMLGQNWDDHNRSGRYIARDFGKNYLTCIDKNGIIFTNGDNDTFPLWYVQEVENFRPDVRVCNLSYIQTDWYINQMKKNVYDSPALPISMNESQYVQGVRDIAYLLNKFNRPLSLDESLGWLLSENPITKRIEGYNERIDYLPAKEFYLSIDTTAVKTSESIPTYLQDSITPQMNLSLTGKSVIHKGEIAILDMLNTINKEGWKRPIYFAGTVSESLYMGLQHYFNQVGLAYQVLPIKGTKEGSIDVNKMYDNLMNKFVWGGIDNPQVYLDENCRNISRNMRNTFYYLAAKLASEGDSIRPIRLLDHCQEKILATNVPLDESAIYMGNIYLTLGADDKGENIIEQIGHTTLEELKWMLTLPTDLLMTVSQTARRKLQAIQLIATVYGQHNKTKLYHQYVEAYETLGAALQSALTSVQTN